MLDLICFFISLNAIACYYILMEPFKFLPLPPSFIYFIAKNGHSKMQFKLFKCSKSLQNLVRKIRGGCQVDCLWLFSNEIPKLWWDFNEIYFHVNTNFLSKFDGIISVKNDLRILNIENYSIFSSKIKPLHLDLLDFTDCKLNKTVLEKFIMSQNLGYLSLLDCEVVDFDILYHAISRMPNLWCLRAPWQSDLSSMEALIKIQRNEKLYSCTIHNISEFISPKLIATFAIKHIKNNGELILYFLNPISGDYSNQVYDGFKYLTKDEFMVRLSIDYD